METIQEHQSVAKENEVNYEVDLNGYKFDKTHVGLIVTLSDENTLNSDEIFDTFSKILSNLKSTCKILMVVKNNIFKLIIRPNYSAYWLDTMLSLKFFITGVISTISCNFKQIKLSNDKHENLSMEMVCVVNEILLGDDNTDVKAAVFNDKKLSLAFMMVLKNVIRSNRYDGDPSVGVYVTIPSNEKRAANNVNEKVN
ncbi:hypothetical protein CsNV_067 [Callinectes sapidus nudivirus]|nr:hypothetical protein CsNV_067 [Callinectes sapidus nudivirus]